MKGGFRAPRGRPESGAHEGPFAPHQIKHLTKVEFDRARRYGYPLCVAVLKADRIEALADLHGHRLRDLVQETIARILQKETRSSDLFGRHVEDRFLILLPHTAHAGAQRLVERVRRRVAEFNLELGSKVLTITVSVGLAEYAERNALFCDAVVALAEAALEQARQEGGNRSLLAATPATGPAPTSEDPDDAGTDAVDAAKPGTGRRPARRR